MEEPSSQNGWRLDMSNCCAIYQQGHESSQHWFPAVPNTLNAHTWTNLQYTEDNLPMLNWITISTECRNWWPNLFVYVLLSSVTSSMNMTSSSLSSDNLNTVFYHIVIEWTLPQ
jgi:hypothetical protein